MLNHGLAISTKSSTIVWHLFAKNRCLVFNNSKGILHVTMIKTKHPKKCSHITFVTLLILFSYPAHSPSLTPGTFRFCYIIIILQKNTYNIKVFYTIYAKMKEKGVQKNYIYRKLVVVVGCLLYVVKSCMESKCMPVEQLCR